MFKLGDELEGTDTALFTVPVNNGDFEKIFSYVKSMRYGFLSGCIKV